MAGASVTLLRTCIRCRRQAEPVTLADVNDFDAMRAFWARIAAGGWRTDSRGNQRCKDCPEDYPERPGSLERGVAVQ